MELESEGKHTSPTAPGDLEATVQFSWVEASQAFSLYLIEGPFAFPVSHMTDLGLCPPASSRTNHRAQIA